ncbi:uncharacterized protein LOC143667835 [Tamandua tetradactyla]|uniref:uncharacterized protein LOC143667835 n=1 Tax=Tamandua tetradactyla TaxID=48850 RepID=UPI0040547C6D
MLLAGEGARGPAGTAGKGPGDRRGRGAGSGGRGRGRGAGSGVDRPGKGAGTGGEGARGPAGTAGKGPGDRRGRGAGSGGRGRGRGAGSGRDGGEGARGPAGTAGKGRGVRRKGAGKGRGVRCGQAGEGGGDQRKGRGVRRGRQGRGPGTSGRGAGSGRDGGEGARGPAEGARGPAGTAGKGRGVRWGRRGRGAGSSGDGGEGGGDSGEGKTQKLRVFWEAAGRDVLVAGPSRVQRGTEAGYLHPGVGVVPTRGPLPSHLPPPQGPGPSGCSPPTPQDQASRSPSQLRGLWEPERGSLGSGGGLFLREAGAGRGGLDRPAPSGTGKPHAQPQAFHGAFLEPPRPPACPGPPRAPGHPLPTPGRLWGSLCPSCPEAGAGKGFTWWPSPAVAVWSRTPEPRLCPLELGRLGLPTLAAGPRPGSPSPTPHIWGQETVVGAAGGAGARTLLYPCPAATWASAPGVAQAPWGFLGPGQHGQGKAMEGGQVTPQSARCWHRVGGSSRRSPRHRRPSVSPTSWCAPWRQGCAQGGGSEGIADWTPRRGQAWAELPVLR